MADLENGRGGGMTERLSDSTFEDLALRHLGHDHGSVFVAEARRAREREGRLEDENAALRKEVEKLKAPVTIHWVPGKVPFLYYRHCAGERCALGARWHLYIGPFEIRGGRPVSAHAETCASRLSQGRVACDCVAEDGRGA